MAEIMVPSKGCVYIAGGSSGGQGFYALNPPLRGSASSPILLDGADTTFQDIVFPVTTLDEKKYFYTMGDDFGNISVGGIVLLGKSETKGAMFSKVKKYFESNRSIVRKSPITLSCPGNVTVKFYLTSMVMARADPEFHLQFFQFRGVLVEPKKA